MKIIRQYILTEWASNFAAVLGVLTFVLLIGNIFLKMADLVINRGVDMIRLGQLILFMAPFLLAFTLPMAALVATLLTFGRLSAEHELTALRASGISLRKAIQPIIWIAVVLSLVAFVLNDRIASQSHFRMRQVSAQIGMESPTALLEEGVFMKKFRDIVIFIHRINGNSLEQVRIYQPQPDGPTRTIIAEKGELIPSPEENLIKLRLINGTSDEPDANHPGRFYKLKFGTYYLPLDTSRLNVGEPVERKRKELTIKELWAMYVKLKHEGYDDPYLLTEINRKIAMSLSVFVLVCLSVPLAIRTHRGEKSIGFAIALLLGTIYWTLLMGVTMVAKTGTAPAVVVMHLPNILFLITAFFLYRKVIRS